MRKLHARLSCIAVALALFSGCGSDDDDGGGSGGSSGSGGSAGTGGSSGAGQGVTCDGACSKFIQANCSQGPPSAAICAAFCNGVLNGNDATCAAAMRAFLGCLDDSSTFTCNAEGAPQSAECQPELDAVNPCLPAP